MLRILTASYVSAKEATVKGLLVVDHLVEILTFNAAKRLVYKASTSLRLDSLVGKSKCTSSRSRSASSTCLVSYFLLCFFQTLATVFLEHQKGGKGTPPAK